MRFVWTIALAVLSPVPGFGQERELKEAIAQCGAVEDITERLICFDTLANAVAQMSKPKPVASAPSAVDARTPGQWEVQVTKDPLDDTTVVALGVLGAELEAELVLRCMQRRLDVVLSWKGRFIGAKDPVVWTRLGNAKAEKKRWSLSSDFKLAYLSGDTKPFVQQLLSVDRLLAQTDNFGRRITETFDLRGLRDAIGPLKKECIIN